MHKKVASLVTTAILVVTMSTTMVIANPLSDKLKQQQNKLEQNKNNYKKAQNKVEQIEEQIEKYDQQIEGLMSEIKQTKAKINSIENDINVSQEQIEKAQKDMEEEQELYNQRMKTMYMNGAGGYLEVIFGAENLSDLFQKVEVVKKLTELDKNILNELKEKQEALRTKQSKLNKEKENLVTLNKNQESKVEKLKQDKQKQDDLIKEAKKQSKKYSSELNKDQSQIKETERLIKEAVKKASSSANSSSNARPSRGDGNPPANTSSDSVVAYASKFRGRPYVWGANGPNSFDCSGFTKYVYAHFGVGLPRVSRDQATAGQYVSRSNLQAGDLVFFGRGTIHHVGIYVGNNSYIHAPRTGDVVKISSLSGRSDFAAARRVK